MGTGHTKTVNNPVQLSDAIGIGIDAIRVALRKADGTISFSKDRTFCKREADLLNVIYAEKITNFGITLEYECTEYERNEANGKAANNETRELMERLNEAETKLSEAKRNEANSKAMIAENEMHLAEIEKLRSEAKARGSEIYNMAVEIKRIHNELSNKDNELLTIRNELEKAQNEINMPSSIAQILRDVVIVIGVLFTAYGILSLYSFSVIGWFASVIFTLFYGQALIEVRQKKKVKTAKMLTAYAGAVGIGSWWVDYQMLNNHYSDDLAINANWANVNLVASFFFAATLYIVTIATKTANEEK